jgi:hypothetical protein
LRQSTRTQIWIRFQTDMIILPSKQNTINHLYIGQVNIRPIASFTDLLSNRHTPRVHAGETERSMVQGSDTSEVDCLWSLRLCTMAISDISYRNCQRRLSRTSHSSFPSSCGC